MPNLSETAVATWLAEREPDLMASLPPPSPLPPHLASLVVELGRTLDTAQLRDPERLGRLLRLSPAWERVQLLLAQLDVPRRIRMLAWLGAAPMPQPHLVIESYLTGTQDPDSRSLHQELQGLHRNALLLRIFRHERISSLLAGCQIAGQAEPMA